MMLLLIRWTGADSLTPVEVGLPPGSRRRTPGLRRDEVARLAYMSAVYYERLEQARGPQPSAMMLVGIADALRLNDDERAHLHLLAGLAPPVRVDPLEEVDAGLAFVMDSLGTTAPALVCDELGFLLGRNRLHVTLFGGFGNGAGYASNIVWLWFTSAEWRALLTSVSLEDEIGTGLAYVADLRARLARRGHDRRAAGLVADLLEASEEFASLWAEHRVAGLNCHRKIVEDERVGRLVLDCQIVLSPSMTQRLLILQPAPGTGTAERLARLS